MLEGPIGDRSHQVNPLLAEVFMPPTVLLAEVLEVFLDEILEFFAQGLLALAKGFDAYGLDALRGIQRGSLFGLAGGVVLAIKPDGVMLAALAFDDSEFWHQISPRSLDIRKYSAITALGK